MPYTTTLLERIVGEIIMDDVNKYFILMFDLEDANGIWRREISKRYEQYLEKGLIEFITVDDIGTCIGRDYLNLRRRITNSMVESKLYIRITEHGESLLAFDEL